MIRLVLTTFPDQEVAAAAVRTLVEEKLAACGTLLPGVRSLYRWKGALEDAGEVLVIFKTTEAARPRLESRLREVHPYEIPEILTVEPSHVASAYARWISDEVDGAGNCPAA